MKHAVLGIGGVGGLVAGLLAKSGQQVGAIVRPQVLAAHPDHILIDQPRGQTLANVRITSALDSSVDVFWIAVKATQLEAALEKISAKEALVGTVIPLLNGIDHVERLREFFGQRVVPATISVESERIAPGHIVQRSPFVRFAISDLGESQLQGVMEKLSAFGTEYHFIASEATLMWSKLCLLAPLALTTTASERTIGEILSDPQWEALLRSSTIETCAVAVTEGAAIDSAKIALLHSSLPQGMRSSMQKDVAAGRLPELDAIAGPVLRGAKKNSLPVTTCQYLNDLIVQRVGVSRFTANQIKIQITPDGKKRSQRKS